MVFNVRKADCSLSGLGEVRLDRNGLERPAVAGIDCVWIVAQYLLHAGAQSGKVIGIVGEARARREQAAAQ